MLSEDILGNSLLNMQITQLLRVIDTMMLLHVQQQDIYYNVQYDNTKIQEWKFNRLKLEHNIRIHSS